MRIKATLYTITFYLKGRITVNLDVEGGIAPSQLKYVVRKLEILEGQMATNPSFFAQKTSTAQPTSTEAESKRIFVA